MTAFHSARSVALAVSRFAVPRSNSVADVLGHLERAREIAAGQVLEESGESLGDEPDVVNLGLDRRRCRGGRDGRALLDSTSVEEHPVTCRGDPTAAGRPRARVEQLRGDRVRVGMRAEHAAERLQCCHCLEAQRALW